VKSWAAWAAICLIGFVTNADSVEYPTAFDITLNWSATRAGDIAQKEPEFARVDGCECAIGNPTLNNQRTPSGGCFDGKKPASQGIPKIGFDLNVCLSRIYNHTSCGRGAQIVTGCVWFQYLGSLASDRRDIRHQKFIECIDHVRCWLMPDVFGQDSNFYRAGIFDRAVESHKGRRDPGTISPCGGVARANYAEIESDQPKQRDNGAPHRYSIKPLGYPNLPLPETPLMAVVLFFVGLWASNRGIERGPLWLLMGGWCAAVVGGVLLSLGGCLTCLPFCGRTGLRFTDRPPSYKSSNLIPSISNAAIVARRKVAAIVPRLSLLAIDAFVSCSPCASSRVASSS
jgi:hypothetical protein